MHRVNFLLFVYCSANDHSCAAWNAQWCNHARHTLCTNTSTHMDPTPMFVSVPNRMSMNHHLKQHLALNLVATPELTEEPRLDTAVQNDNLNQKHHSLQASVFYPRHCPLPAD